jgi:two-component system, cell cycle response regulator CpdR
MKVSMMPGTRNAAPIQDVEFNPDRRNKRHLPMAKAVLVVDDEPLNNGGDARRAGCEVLTAATGSEARTTIAQELHIAILITDINMPGMGGYELADRATRVRNGLQVILLSGRERDGHGFPLIRKTFLEADLRRVTIETTGLC